jgi:hypothetical protein
MKNEDKPSLMDYYNKYCKILTKITIAATRMTYDNYVKTSHNKQKSTWKIINAETGRTPKHNDYQDLIKKFNDSNAAEQINQLIVSVVTPLI